MSKAKDMTKNTAFWLVTLVVLVNVLLLTPTVVNHLPISQYDGAYYYNLARTWKEKGFNAELEPKIPGVDTVSDFPPVLIWMLKKMLDFGLDIWVINGVLVGLIFVIGNIYLYFLVKKLTKDKTAALLTLVFSVLSVRAYYSIFAGIWPTTVAISFSWIALFYVVCFLEKPNTKNMLPVIALNLLVIFTHTVSGIFLLFIEAFLCLGFVADKKIKIEFPKINFEIKQQQNKKDYSLLLVFGISIFAVIVSIPLYILVGQKQGWLTPWFDNMLSTYGGYQVIWQYFLVLDGPIITILAAVGALLLIYRANNWKTFSIILAGFLMVVSRKFIIAGGVYGIENYFLKFYPMFFVLMALSASIVLARFIRNKKLKNVGIALVILAILFQIAVLGYFYSKIQPAITDDELSAAKFILHKQPASVLYVYNIPEDASFRSSYWILVLSHQKSFKTAESLPDRFDENLVLIADKTKVTNTGQLDKYKEVFNRGVVIVYEK